MIPNKVIVPSVLAGMIEWNDLLGTWIDPDYFGVLLVITTLT
jgi:hypothetical protein